MRERVRLDRISPEISPGGAVAVFRLYGTFVRTAFLKMLAYRMRYVTGVITYLMFVSVNYYIWKAIFAQKPPGAEINGFSLPEMVTYVTIGWIARSLYFSNIDVEMNELVVSGEISNFLIRPIRFHVMMLAQAFGEMLFRICFFSFPIAIVLVLLFPVQAPVSLEAGSGFLLATLFSFLLFAEINFLVGLLAFALKSIDGVMRAKYFLIQLFSGLLLPLTFFPDTVRAVLDYLPFTLIAYTPLEIYLGKVSGTGIIQALGEQALWFLLLLALSVFCWNKAMSRLSVQGG